MTGLARFLQVVILAKDPPTAAAIGDGLSLKRGTYVVAYDENHLRGLDPARLVVIAHSSRPRSLDVPISYYRELGSVVLTVS